MARLPALTFDELTPEQKKLWQEIGAVRSGSPGGPFAVWMHYPKIAERAHHLGNAVRLEGKLGRRLLELAVLVVARHWNAEYVFAAHVPAGTQAGLSRSGDRRHPHASKPGLRQGRREAGLRHGTRAAGDQEAERRDL